MQLGQELSVETELNQRRAAGFFRELRLDRLVSPITEPTLAGDAKKDVGPSRPRAVLEPSLNDDVRAFAHRGERLVERRRSPFDLNDALPRSREVLDVRPLVIQTALLKNLDHRVVEERPLRQPVRLEPLERHEMAAREEVRQVGREEEWSLASKIHSSTPETVPRVARFAIRIFV